MTVSIPGSAREFQTLTGESVALAGVAGVTQPRVILTLTRTTPMKRETSASSGVVLLSLLVDADGHTSNIRVQRWLGMGLDQKTVQTASQMALSAGPL
jgi:hypothetical protein